MQIAFTRNIGFILLSVYLILVGITGLVPTLAVPTLVYSLLALLAGIFILIGM